MTITENSQVQKPLSLLVATPSLRGEFCTAYLESITGLQSACLNNRASFRLATATHISVIDRARNMLTHMFLNQSDATHMLFVDDDMGFNVSDVWRMIELRDTAEVLAAMYSSKKHDWATVKKAVLDNPTIAPEHIPMIAGTYRNMWTLKPNVSLIVGNDPVRVQAIGTGVMLISRDGLMRLIERKAVAQIQHGPEEFGYAGSFYEFFKTKVTDDGRQFGEDYFFCNLVNDSNGTVVGCPWVRTTHIGSCSFIGDLRTMAHYMGK